MAHWYIFGSVIAVSLISVLAALPLLAKRKVPPVLLLTLLSLSVGTLLGSVFIHFFPEMMEHGYNLSTALYLLTGFLIMFVLEKLIHAHHEHGLEKGHGHGYHLAPINLIGDGVHNFIDGLVIAGAYLVSIPLGVAATVSVLLHEVPQEIADFGILLYSGMSRVRALLFNLFSASAAIVGAVIGLVLNDAAQVFSAFIIPFAAGTFIYIAASNLVPELHRRSKLGEAALQIVAIVVGVGIMVLVGMIGPGV